MRNPANLILFLNALILGGILVTSALSADEIQQLQKDGMLVQITPAKDTIAGYKAYHIVLQNKTDQDRSLHLQLLPAADPASGPSANSGCTIFAGLKAGSSRSLIKQCQQSDPTQIWSGQIVKVYPFLLDPVSSVETTRFPEQPAIQSAG